MVSVSMAKSLTTPLQTPTASMTAVACKPPRTWTSPGYIQPGLLKHKPPVLTTLLCYQIHDTFMHIIMSKLRVQGGWTPRIPPKRIHPTVTNRIIDLMAAHMEKGMTSALCSYQPQLPEVLYP